VAGYLQLHDVQERGVVASTGPAEVVTVTPSSNTFELGGTRYVAFSDCTAPWGRHRVLTSWVSFALIQLRSEIVGPNTVPWNRAETGFDEWRRAVLNVTSNFVNARDRCIVKE